MSRLSSPVFVVLLILLSGFAVFFELGRMDVSTDNEGQRAAPPAEMLRSGDFVVPTLNGEPYLKKPPLLYWAIAGLYTVFGTADEGLARIPTATCAILLILSVYLVFRRLTGETAARWSALMLLVSPYFLERARWASLDVPLLLFTFLAVAGLYAAWRNDTAGRRVGLAVLAGLALGAATLLKGPPPYLFVLGAWFIFALLHARDPDRAVVQAGEWTLNCLVVAVVFMFLPVGFPVALVLLVACWVLLLVRHAGRDALPSLRLTLLAIAVAVAVTAPWATAVLMRGDWGAVADLIRGEVTERTHTATSINSGTVFYYFLALPGILAPWGLLLLAFLRPSLSRHANPHYRFGLFSGAFSILIFSLIAGKEYEYILPAVPWLLLPLGVLVANWEAGFAPKAYRWWRTGFALLLLVAAVVLPFHAAIDGMDNMLVLELAGFAVVAVALMVWGPTRRDALTRIAVTGLMVILSFLLIRSFDYRNERSPKTIGAVCREITDAGYTVEATKVYPHFTYYASNPITENHDLEAVRAKLAGDTPYFYLTREKLLEEFGSAFPEGMKTIIGPHSNKELMLVTNPAGAALMDPDTGRLRASD